jgi:hypothetical protein
MVANMRRNEERGERREDDGEGNRKKNTCFYITEPATEQSI